MPTYAIIDSQSVKTASSAHDKGFDGGKKIGGVLGAIDNSKKEAKGFKILFPHNHPKPLPCPETRLQMKHGQDCCLF